MLIVIIISLWVDADQSRSPEDQDHSLGLYGLPFSLLESTFIAKLLHLFHFTAIVGQQSDIVVSELCACASKLCFNRVGRNQ